MRQQRAFSFMVGYPIGTDHMKIKAFEAEVVTAISLVCGGCETDFTTGWWRDDGADNTEEFTGQLHRENTISFNFTAENRKAERAYSAARKAIVLSAKRNKLDTNWVHVKETRILGRHFSVQEDYDEING